MTGDRKTDRAALDRLADALVDDILSASDEEILAETTDTHGDPEELAAEMRALFEKTFHEEGKAKLVAAKKAANAARTLGPTVVPLDNAEARRRYERMVAGDSELSDKLTMAARKGEGESERDIEGVTEDLAELGAFDQEDDST
jgi:hypothetical protein